MKKIFLSIGALILIVTMSFFILSTTHQKKSLTNEILQDINFSKIQANILITEKDKFYKIKPDDSNNLIKNLKLINVKKSKKPKIENHNTLVFSGSGGSFQIFFYKDQYIKIYTKDTDSFYRIIETNKSEEINQIINKISKNKSEQIK